MLLLAAMMLSAPDAALTPEHADARCLAVLAQATQTTTDKALAAQIQIGALFFTGKLLGRNPGIDLTKVLTQQISQLKDPKMISAELARCGAELQAAGGRLVEAGDKLQGK